MSDNDVVPVGISLLLEHNLNLERTARLTCKPKASRRLHFFIREYAVLPKTLEKSTHEMAFSNAVGDTDR